MLNAFNPLIVVVHIHRLWVVIIIILIVIIIIVIKFDNVILVPALLRGRERLDGIKGIDRPVRPV